MSAAGLLRSERDPEEMFEGARGKFAVVDHDDQGEGVDRVGTIERGAETGHGLVGCAALFLLVGRAS